MPVWRNLGAGLITGAADNDPQRHRCVFTGRCGIWLWHAVVRPFTMPLMIAIQAISAGIGCVTGGGLMDGIRTYYPRTLVYLLVISIFIANVINRAADVGAMGAALKLLIGGSSLFYVARFALLSLVLQVSIPFSRCSPILKLLTLSLFAYIAAAMVIHVPWLAVFEERRDAEGDVECRIHRGPGGAAGHRNSHYLSAGKRHRK